MTAQDNLRDLVEARRKIVSIRGEVQFSYPLADAKLIRVCNYLSSQANEAERLVWEEAGLLEVEP